MIDPPKEKYSKIWEVKDYPDARDLRNEKVKQLEKDGWEWCLVTYHGIKYGVEAWKEA